MVTRPAPCTGQQSYRFSQHRSGKKQVTLFAGWNTQADGKGTAYQAGDTFEIAANTVLYAQWNKLPAEEETRNTQDG